MDTFGVSIEPSYGAVIPPVTEMVSPDLSENEADLQDQGPRVLEPDPQGHGGAAGHGKTKIWDQKPTWPLSFHRSQSCTNRGEPHET